MLHVCPVGPGGSGGAGSNKKTAHADWGAGEIVEGTCTSLKKWRRSAATQFARGSAQPRLEGGVLSSHYMLQAESLCAVALLDRQKHTALLFLSLFSFHPFFHLFSNSLLLLQKLEKERRELENELQVAQEKVDTSTDTCREYQEKLDAADRAFKKMAQEHEEQLKNLKQEKAEVATLSQEVGSLQKENDRLIEVSRCTPTKQQQQAVV